MSYSKKTAKTKSAIIYTRVSTDEQAIRGNSLQDQEEVLRRSKKSPRFMNPLSLKSFFLKYNKFWREFLKKMLAASKKQMTEMSSHCEEYCNAPNVIRLGLEADRKGMEGFIFIIIANMDARKEAMR